jgi:hypothetical protein
MWVGRLTCSPADTLRARPGICRLAQKLRVIVRPSIVTGVMTRPFFLSFSTSRAASARRFATGT